MAETGRVFQISISGDPSRFRGGRNRKFGVPIRESTTHDYSEKQNIIITIPEVTVANSQ